MFYFTFGLGGLMLASNATCLTVISVNQHKLFNSVPYYNTHSYKFKFYYTSSCKKLRS